jgi:hypothetical protein
MGEFERIMQPEAWGGDNAEARLAHVCVADTVHSCLVWWRQYAADIPVTAADLLTMARLMLEREEQNLRRAIGGPAAAD